MIDLIEFDLFQPPNDVVSYAIPSSGGNNNQNLFTINPTTGDIYLRSSLIGALDRYEVNNV